MRRTGQVIAVTTTKQTFGLGDPQDLYTLCNDDGVGVVYYRGADPSDFAGTNSVLLAAGANKLDAGEKITVKGGAYDFACATGGAASCRVIYGNSSSSGGEADLNAFNGVMTHVTHGRTVVSGAAAVTTLTAGSACKYWRLKLSTGSAAIYYHPDGTDATAGGGADAGHEELDATTGYILIKKTAATTLKVWVTVSGATINWEAGN